MSARLIFTLIAVMVVASGLVVARWIVQPAPATLPAADGASGAATTDAARRERREDFFGGNAERDIRSGQEMKPRW
ncbi:entry exclusion protein TrbK [Rhizobium acaciae]|uniref:entry exclusion protein TrbK n=1 Tax=Rhizobium acaciae TaxID=2989736 RepID=UPI003F962EF9